MLLGRVSFLEQVDTLFARVGICSEIVTDPFHGFMGVATLNINYLLSSDSQSIDQLHPPIAMSQQAPSFS